MDEVERLKSRVEDLERQIAAIHARELRRMGWRDPDPPVSALVYVGGTAKITDRTKCKWGELITIEYSGGKFERDKP